MSKAHEVNVQKTPVEDVRAPHEPTPDKKTPMEKGFDPAGQDQPRQEPEDRRTKNKGKRQHA